MLLGLVGILVPILIHLLNRSRAKVLDWGAMRFLLASLTSQNRRILIEEMILLALRCLVVALVVLAMAQLYLLTRPTIPWGIVLPAFFGAVVCVAVAGAMWAHRAARWALLAAALALAVAAGAATAIERYLQGLKWASASGEADVAILIDASLSMTVDVEGRTNFARAVEEVRDVVAACEPGDAISILLAGPVPRAVVAVPTPDRRELAEALEALAPVGGTMNVLEAFNAAAASLAEGRNAVKKIVLITDGQNVGWDLRSKARWEFLAEGLDSLPTRPRVFCRILALPSGFRNAALADVALSRKVVGTDRPVTISVKVMNTGSGLIQPSRVELIVDGKQVDSRDKITPIRAKATETVAFEYRFPEAGRRLVSARVVMPDDHLPGDDSTARVIDVIDKLAVLIVDGTPSSRLLGGAGAYIDIALTPKELPSGKDGQSQIANGESQIAFLVEPRVVPAPDIATVENLGDYAAVVLANVPRLPASVAADLASFVERGGGLLIAPGARARPTFYDGWHTKAGVAVTPARLAERRSADATPARLRTKSFSHPALALLADAKLSDAPSALVKSYWKLAANERDPQVRVGGRLDTGEPFLVEGKLGRGRVLMTATSLDHKGSNRPALKSFVPMVHELVYYLASPMVLDANMDPGTEATLELRARRRSGAGSCRGSGLRAEYFRDANLAELAASQVDPTVDFDWQQGSPQPLRRSDGFSVRWTGWVEPRYSERYTFCIVADDGARLWVDGQLLIEAWQEQSAEEHKGSMALRAGRRYPIRMEYYENGGDAVARLLWYSPSQRKEAIPQSQLHPSWRGSAPREDGPADVVEVITPSGRTGQAKLTSDGGMLRVSYTGTEEPGLYTLKLPADLAELYAPEAADGEGVPFVVLSKVEESCLDALAEDDLGQAAQHLDLFTTERADELTAAVTGSVPMGAQLWKYFAIGALLVLLGEIAVSRWITVQRRLHATETVAFGSDEAAEVESFRERAKRLLAVPSKPTETVAKP